METRIIEKVDTRITKDVLTSILTKASTYNVDIVIKTIEMMSSAFVILPDAFELEVDEHESQHVITTKIVNMINAISIKQNDLELCPSCKGRLFHHNKHLMCTNINCIINDDIKSVLRIKLILLVPSVPIHHISMLINKVEDAGEALTLNSIIQYIFFECRDENIIDVVNQFKKAIRQITMTQFFQAVIGSPFPPDIDEVIKYYSDQLIFMMADAEYVFENLYSINLKHDLRILLVNITTANHEFLRLINSI